MRSYCFLVNQKKRKFITSPSTPRKGGDGLCFVNQTQNILTIEMRSSITNASPHQALSGNRLVFLVLMIFVIEVRSYDTFGENYQLPQVDQTWTGLKTDKKLYTIVLEVFKNRENAIYYVQNYSDPERPYLIYHFVNKPEYYYVCVRDSMSLQGAQSKRDELRRSDLNNTFIQELTNGESLEVSTLNVIKREKRKSTFKTSADNIAFIDKIIPTPAYYREFNRQNPDVDSLAVSTNKQYRRLDLPKPPRKKLVAMRREFRNVCHPDLTVSKLLTTNMRSYGAAFDKFIKIDASTTRGAMMDSVKRLLRQPTAILGQNPSTSKLNRLLAQHLSDSYETLTSYLSRLSRTDSIRESDIDTIRTIVNDINRFMKVESRAVGKVTTKQQSSYYVSISRQTHEFVTHDVLGLFDLSFSDTKPMPVLVYVMHGQLFSPDRYDVKFARPIDVKKYDKYKSCQGRASVTYNLFLPIIYYFKVIDREKYPDGLDLRLVSTQDRDMAIPRTGLPIKETEEMKQARRGLYKTAYKIILDEK